MNALKEYDIVFSGLKEGIHHFQYPIGGDFFGAFEYDDFCGADISAEVELVKRPTLLELKITHKGTVRVNCDVTDEPFDLPLEGERELVVKFGEEYNDDNDEMIVIPFSEHKLNIARFLFEDIVLSVPAKRYHPDYLSGKIGPKGPLTGLNEE